MLKNALRLLRIVLLAASAMLAGLSYAAVTSNEFCWLDSYGRGVGTIPTHCSDGKSNQNGLCYSDCQAGYDGVGPVCWQQCPSGYVNTGFTCHIDKPLVVSGSTRCTYRLWGLCLWYTTDCPWGYGHGGLGLCSLNSGSVPAGMTGTWLDPVKHSYPRGAGTIPNACPGGELDAGLCYRGCEPGYDGVGPVCWNRCPAGKQACGMGCADNATACAEVTANQVVSSLQLVATIASAGAAGPAFKAADEAESMTRTEQALAKLKQTWASVRNSPQYQYLKQGNDLRKLEALVTSSSPEEAMRNAAGLDPSGVVSSISAFYYPVCNRVAPAPVPQPLPPLTAPPFGWRGGERGQPRWWLPHFQVPNSGGEHGRFVQ